MKTVTAVYVSMWAVDCLCNCSLLNMFLFQYEKVLLDDPFDIYLTCLLMRDDINLTSIFESVFLLLLCKIAFLTLFVKTLSFWKRMSILSQRLNEIFRSGWIEFRHYEQSGIPGSNPALFWARNFRHFLKTAGISGSFKSAGNSGIFQKVQFSGTF